jgi:hypothetical protein
VSRKTGCYVWTAATANGYPLFTFRGEDGKYQRMSARRWLWQHQNGPLVPAEIVTDVCGNDLCVNLHHLRVATRQELAYAWREA